MAKKIKSFTVEEDVYSSLVRVFKETGSDASVSLFISNCLTELLSFLEKVQKERKESKFTVPMSFIIDSIVKSKDILGFYRDWPEELPDKTEFMLMEWQDDYEAKEKKIPVEFYQYIKSGLYVFSPNKKYLIEKKSGKRYMPVGRNRLVPLDSKDKS